MDDSHDDVHESVYEALFNFVSDFTRYRTLEGLVHSLSGRLHQLTPFDQLVVVLHDPATGAMRIALEEPAGELVPPKDSPLSAGQVPADFGPAGWAWQSQRPADYSLVDEQNHPTLHYLRSIGYKSVCFVPLTTPRQRLGTLGFGSRKIDRYSPLSITLMERTAGLLALAVEHTSQLEDLERLASDIAEERDRARLLLEVTTAVASVLNLTELLGIISRLLRDTIPHHYASVTLWDAEAQQLRRRALVFPHGRGIIQNDALLGSHTAPPRLAFDRGETMLFRFEDIERLDGHSAGVMAAEQLRSLCCVPLKTARRGLGTLNVARPDDSPFSTEDVGLLEQIAQQLSIAIENALHFEQAEKYRSDATAQRDRLQLLLDVSNALVARVGPGPLELSVLETVRTAVPHDYASVTIYDPEAHALRLEAVTHYDERGFTAPRTPLPLSESPAGLAFSERKALVFGDLSRFPERGVATLLAAGMQSICCVPLVTRHGVIGTLNVARKGTDVCTPDQVAILVDVAAQVAIAVENTLAFHEISALKDRLNEEKLYLEDEITRRHDFKEIIGSSQALTNVLDQIRTVAPTDATVLLLGETGTGKEQLARAVHDMSRRRERTFVRINGAALPGGLIESELFGYEKGAFTGATVTKVGRLELADRGTLFLDEVGDIPIDVQPKLLRALQEREFERLGSTRTRTVDVRLIAATNRNLEDMMRAGTFRSDLYYRLSVFPIIVPPLRDRPEDIPALVRHFAERFSRELGRPITSIPKPVMDALMRERWPGNIRELENVIERAVILSRGSTLQLTSSAVPRAAASATSAVTAPAIAATAASAPLDFRTGERETILRALRDANGVIGGPEGAAARLGLKRTTLHSKMRKLGIDRPSY